MITSSASRSLLRVSTRCGRSARTAPRSYASYALWKTNHINDEVDVSKAAFFDAFESNASLRGVSYDIGEDLTIQSVRTPWLTLFNILVYLQQNVVYSLSFAADSLETDLASDDTFPLLDDIMMRQLLHSYSTHSLPSSSTAREIRNKLPPHLNLSNLEPFELDAKDSLPDLEQDTQSLTPSGYQPLPKTTNDIDQDKLDNMTRAIVITDVKSPFRITQVNTAWEGLCGYKREECKGRSLGPLLQGPDTDWSAVSALLSQLFAGEEASVVLTNYTKTGRKFRNRITVGPVRDEMGKTVSFVGVLREVKEGDEGISGEYDRLRKEAAQLPFVA